MNKNWTPPFYLVFCNNNILACERDLRNCNFPGCLSSCNKCCMSWNAFSQNPLGLIMLLIDLPLEFPQITADSWNWMGQLRNIPLLFWLWMEAVKPPMAFWWYQDNGKNLIFELHSEKEREKKSLRFSPFRHFWIQIQLLKVISVSIINQLVLLFLCW